MPLVLWFLIGYWVINDIYAIFKIGDAIEITPPGVVLTLAAHVTFILFLVAVL